MLWITEPLICFLNPVKSDCHLSFHVFEKRKKNALFFFGKKLNFAIFLQRTTLLQLRLEGQEYLDLPGLTAVKKITPDVAASCKIPG